MAPKRQGNEEVKNKDSLPVQEYLT